MNTDRELLEMAAKAVGRIVLVQYGETMEFINGKWMRVKWNPIIDDGDALRLAVSLMEFEPYKSRGFLPCISNDAEATRRAIVRAAAEIGKSMP